MLSVNWLWLNGYLVVLFKVILSDSGSVLLSNVSLLLMMLEVVLVGVLFDVV